MSIKDRLSAKSANIQKFMDQPDGPDTGEPKRPKTAPGQLMASMPLLAEKERENEELKARLKISESNAHQLELPLSALHEVPGRRRHLTVEQYAELKENLRSNRLVTPITVRARPDSGYEIISGHNRIAIYREIGRDKIIASVLTDASDYVAESSALYANLLQSDLTDFEKYLGFKRLIALTGHSQQKVAIEAGVSKQALSRWMSFGDLPVVALNAIAAAPEKLGANAAEALSILVSVGKSAVVIEAVLAIVDGSLTQDAAVRRAQAAGKNIQKSARPDPVIFRAGKKVYCKLTGIDKTIRLDCMSEEVRIEIEAAIKGVLDRLSKPEN